MADSVESVSVVGLGKLGAPMAACLAAKGFSTFAVDLDREKIESVNRGRAPVYEPGLHELIGSLNGRLTASDDYEYAVMNSAVSFVVVPTPTDNLGGFSLRYVTAAVERIGLALRQKRERHVVAITSTVMPGSTEQELKPLLERNSGKRCGRDFGLCYSPEFIALGSVIRNFLNPDFILIGESDHRSGEMLASLYERLCENRPPIARMNLVNAELAKLAVNTFVTTKITFANTLARICEQLPGADVDVVTNAIGMDSRIGRKYLKGGLGYGGPCFPRDNRALSVLASSLGASAVLPEATDDFNREQVRWLAKLVQSCLPERGLVAVLGLSYKPDSDVVEQSQGLLLMEALRRAGVRVRAYDPAASASARVALGASANLLPSASECIRGADVVVVATAWEEFKTLFRDNLAPPGRRLVLIDCWRLLDNIVDKNAITYIPLGVYRQKQCSQSLRAQNPSKEQTLTSFSETP